MAGADAIERLLKHDRRVVIAALAIILFASWAYILAGAGMGMSALDMSSLRLALGRPVATPMGEGASTEMSGPMAAMGMPVAWSLSYAVLMFFMWWIMMIAMMLPSAAPMILLHAAITRRASGSVASSGGRRPTAAFVGGYLLAWAGFSAVAVGLQWQFERLGLLSPMTLSSTNALFAAGILIFAGFYQLTPLKQACLRHCRGQIDYLTRHWRRGVRGAFAMGIGHGAYCLGCCWGLMAILFFGGIMNLYWIIGLALIVLMEKLMPRGRILSLATGGLLLVWGALYLYGALTGAGQIA